MLPTIFAPEKLARRAAFAALSTFLLSAGAAGAAEIELISRLSYSPGSTQPGAARVEERGAFSADGRFYVYATMATAVLPGLLDLNGGEDVFLVDRVAGTTRLLSAARRSPKVTGDGASSAPRLSADGRFVLFTSAAGDLLDQPTSFRQVYLYEVATGQLRLVSHRAGQPGEAVAGDGDGGAISVDGRFVAFWTTADASELMPAIADLNVFQDIFVWDSVLDVFELATRKADAPNETPGSPSLLGGISVTVDGELALVGPQRLVYPQPGGALNSFIFDSATVSYTLASRSSGSPLVPGNAPVSALCDFSADGRYLLFTGAATDHVAGQVDGNGADDLFLFDRVAGTVELISAAVGQPLQAGDRISRCGSLSADGGAVVFASRAGDLAAASDTNSDWDLYRRERATAATTLLSERVTSPGAAAGLLHVGAFPAAGGVQLFGASSNDLVAGASLSGSGPWSFRWDEGSGQVGLALHLPGNPAAAAPSEPLAISGDGAAGLYRTLDPVPFTGAANPASGTAQLVLSASPSSPALASPAAFAGRGSSTAATAPYAVIPDYPSAQAADDGSKVAFLTDSNEICGSDRPLCLLDRASGQMRNARHRWDDPNVPVIGQIQPLAISQDGSQLLVQSKSGQHAPTDTNDNWDVFLYDTSARTYELLSHKFGQPTVAADRLSDQYRRGFADLMTPDARRIVFVSHSLDIVPGLTIPAKTHVYVTDRQEGTRRLVSHRDGNFGAGSNGHSFNPHISADGRFIVLASYASDLLAGFVDNNSSSHDIYLFDVSNDLGVQLVSHQAGDDHQGAGLGSDTFLVSVTGRYVVHGNRHPNMVAGATDSNNNFDLFRYDASTGTNQLISHVGGNPLVASSGSCAMISMSTDGGLVLLRCTASDLIPGITGSQLYLWDGADSSFRLVSHRQGAPDQPFLSDSGTARMSPDGSRVFFTTRATDVIPGLEDDGPESWDLFMWERATGRIELITAHLAFSGRTAGTDTCAFDFGYAPPAATGEQILFYCSSPALAPFDNNAGSDLFLATLPRPLFADGFESGGAGRWSAVIE